MGLRRASLAAAAFAVGCQAFDRTTCDHALDAGAGPDSRADVVPGDREDSTLLDAGPPPDRAIETPDAMPVDAPGVDAFATEDADDARALDVPASTDTAPTSDVVVDAGAPPNLLANPSFESTDTAWLLPWSLAVRPVAMATASHDGASVASVDEPTARLNLVVGTQVDTVWVDDVSVSG